MMWLPEEAAPTDEPGEDLAPPPEYETDWLEHDVSELRERLRRNVAGLPAEEDLF